MQGNESWNACLAPGGYLNLSDDYIRRGRGDQKKKKNGVETLL